MTKLTNNINTKFKSLVLNVANLSLGTLLLTLSSCTTTIEGKIGEKISKECASNSECIISIKSITDFKWNKFYVFSSSARLEDINRALGLQYPYYKEFSKILVFTNNGKIVYHEENSADLEHLEDKEVVFNYNDSLKYSSYSANNAVFKAKVSSFKDGIYYELTSVE